VTNATQSTMEPVVADTYDEVIFTDPNEPFYRQLMRISIVPRIQSNYPEVQNCLSQFSDSDHFMKLVEAQRFLERELSSVKERMKLATEDMEQVNVALKEVQEAKNAAAVQRKTKATSAVGNAAKKAKPNP
jgi:K+/H+ antiporter YhaU regulatory subunit KhtT